MIAFIEGKLIWADRDTAIIAAQGVGYTIHIKNTWTSSEFGTEKRLFLSHKISEYGETLYGFETIDEKMIFEQLENIKGIGSKAIYTIMSDLQLRTVSDLQSIVLDQLVKLPGIGKTTAQKFLLGLSNKLKKDFNLEYEEKVQKQEIQTQFKNEIELLVEWGMKKNELLDFIKENPDLFANKNSDQVIQILLKNFRK